VSGRSGRRLAYEPALDGVRAVAVLAVLAFHGGFGWAQGGFLGVSVFFTLSGFLITSLLLAEQAQTGGVAVGPFWLRRVRRLMPAALACLALTMVLAATALTAAKDTLRWDVVATLADVANWRLFASGQSYAQLFAVPSPVQHFWSLAIEEQFYLLFPLAVWLVLVRMHRSRRALAAMLTAGFVASSASAVALGVAHADLVYYATFTRAAELIAGCLLAFVVAARPASDPGAAARWPVVAGPVALAAIVAVMVMTPETATWLYRGGLAAFSLLSVVLIASARRPGPLRSLLSWRPLVGLGLISYGVYLYHWPLFLWLDHDRVGLDGAALFAVRLAATLAVATASYRWLEQPIRRGRTLTGWRGALAPPVAMACLVVAVVPLTAGSAVASAAFAGPRSAPVTLPPLPSSPPTTTPRSAPRLVTTTTTPRRRPVRVVVFGDSTAKADAAGLIAWGRETGRAVVSDAGTIAGCGVTRAAKIQFGVKRITIPDGCKFWPTWWPQVLAQNPADVAVLVDGPWELVPHQIDGDRWRSVGDPVYDRHVHDELLAAVDVLLAHAPVVVLLTNPHVHPGWGETQAGADPVADPARMDRLNEIIRQVAVDRPAVTLVDLAAHVASIPGAETDRGLRPDGVHFTLASSRRIADWLGPAVSFP
jgi:peptidoglycan/LPS O-acetylase OafA/YrhL